MPSSPKIPKEKILQTALDMLIRDGYSSVNIKSLAKELGCSTQPISWHFGNMESFRNELTAEAGRHVREKLSIGEETGLEALEKIGSAYFDIAVDEPNLFRFVCMGESGRHEKNGMSSWLDYDYYADIMKQIVEKYSVTEEQVKKFMQTTIIYMHGTACLIASGMVSETRETIYKMFKEAFYSFLAGIKELK